MLTTTLSTAPTAPLLVEAGAAHGSAFNAVHASAFWVTLGRLVRADPAQRKWVHDNPGALEPGCDTTLRLLPTLEPRELANIAHGMASAGVSGSHRQWAGLWSGIAAAAQPTLGTFRTGELKDLAWAFATSGVLQPPLRDALAVEAVERLDELRAEDIAILAWSFAAGRHDAGQYGESGDVRALLHGIAHAAAQSDLASFGATELATTVWSLARGSDVPVDASAELFFRNVATHLPERVQAAAAAASGGGGGRQVAADYALGPTSVATTAWGLGKVGHATPALLETLARAASAHPLSTYNARTLATLAMPYALCTEELHDTSNRLLAAVAKHASRPEVIATFMPAELLSLARPYADAIGNKRIEAMPSLFSAIARRALEVLPRCTERELSMLPWAFISAGVDSVDRDDTRTLFSALAVEAAPRLAEVRASGLVALCWSYGRHVGGSTLTVRPDERDLFRGIDGADDADEEVDPNCAHLLDLLAEEVAGRHTELSQHDQQTIESCFLRLGRPSPLGERKAFGMLLSDDDGGGDGGALQHEARRPAHGGGHGVGDELYDLDDGDWDVDDGRDLYR